MKSKPSREKVREYNRTYHERHPGRHAEANRAYRDRQRERRLAEKSRSTIVPLTIRGAVAVVPLNNGRFALVDAADFAKLLGCNWYVVTAKNGLRYACGWHLTPSGKRHVLLHQLIFDCRFDRIDHKNRNGLDNRRSNLRPCDQTLNNANQHKVRGAVAFKGVTWDRRAGKFYAQARKHGRNHRLGHFTDPADAARAYDVKAKELFGEFARTNESLGLIPAHGGAAC